MIATLMDAGQAEYGDIAFMQQIMDDIRAGNERGKLLAQGTPDEIQNNQSVIDAYLGAH